MIDEDKKTLLIPRNVIFLHKINCLYIYINVKKMKLVRMIDNYVNDRKYSMIYKNNKINIINYTEIVDFSSTLISVRYENDVYHVFGNNLVISRMMDSEILITGDISNISFD